MRQLQLLTMAVRLSLGKGRLYKTHYLWVLSKKGIGTQNLQG